MNSDMTNYVTTYTDTREADLIAAINLKEATGHYKATLDAYVAVTDIYTEAVYE